MKLARLQHLLIDDLQRVVLPITGLDIGVNTIGKALNLAGNGVFLATNLVSYCDSEMPILPGRDFRAGLLTNIYGSRISVTGGTNFRVGALTT